MNIENKESFCRLCPRDCQSPRTREHPGFCGSDEGFSDLRVTSLMPHYGEERPLSGHRGSGTIFFTGCSLRCCFCQNYDISHEHRGVRLSQEQLADKMEALLKTGVHNLNLVTPSHYADRIPNLLRILFETNIWKKRPVPIIWNSSAYETVNSLKHVADIVDIYLVDMKFHDRTLSDDLCGAPNYAEIAYFALEEMFRQQAQAHYDEDGIMQSGIMIRHLVLPGAVEDSFQVLEQISKRVPLDTALSIMGQYHPRSFNPCERRPDMRRFLSHREYHEVLDYAKSLGFSNILKQA